MIGLIIWFNPPKPGPQFKALFDAVCTLSIVNITCIVNMLILLSYFSRFYIFYYMTIIFALIVLLVTLLVTTITNL